MGTLQAPNSLSFLFCHTRCGSAVFDSYLEDTVTYLLWLFFFVIIIFLGGVFHWSLKREPTEGKLEESDLEEWNCPSCGFTVQMGTECIYCGERKPAAGGKGQ